MNTRFLCLCVVCILLANCNSSASKEAANPAHSPTTGTAKKKYIDVHDLEPGKVSFADVMAAHQKDLATEGKYGVRFIKFWVDEAKGKVYCLSEADDSSSVINTHKEAHGLLPSAVMQVKEGE